MSIVITPAVAMILMFRGHELTGVNSVSLLMQQWTGTTGTTGRTESTAVHHFDCIQKVT